MRKESRRGGAQLRELRKKFSLGILTYQAIPSYALMDRWYWFQKTHGHQSCDQQVQFPANFSSNCLKQLLFCTVQWFCPGSNRAMEGLSLQWPLNRHLKMAPDTSVFHDNYELFSHPLSLPVFLKASLSHSEALFSKGIYPVSTWSGWPISSLPL